MLNESAANDNGIPPVNIPPQTPPPESETTLQEQRVAQIHEIVSDVLMIERQILPPKTEHLPRGNALVMPEAHFVAAFEGRLLIASDDAYEILDAELVPLDLVPIFRTEKGKHVVYVVEGRAIPTPRSWIPNLILFIITIASLLFTGAQMAVNEIAVTDLTEALRMSNNIWPELWRGWPYALAILLILGGHELGHYFAARRHKLAVTLPYFIPFPLGLFGTLGAFIQLREPLKNRRMLLDVGAAGPLMGMIFAIPILFYGLATSITGPINPGGIVEGNSLFYSLAKTLTFGEFLPNGRVDVYVNQWAWAGWTGLFITGLNLIPLGQLDGGHVIYALFGNRARALFFPLIIVLAVLTVISQGALLLLLVLLLLLGRVYAVPLDDITPLNSSRRFIAVLTLILFVAVYVPIPLTTVEFTGGGGPSIIPDTSGASLMLATVGVLFACRGIAARLRR